MYQVKLSAKSILSTWQEGELVVPCLYIFVLLSLFEKIPRTLSVLYFSNFPFDYQPKFIFLILFNSKCSNSKYNCQIFSGTKLLIKRKNIVYFLLFQTRGNFSFQRWSLETCTEVQYRFLASFVNRYNNAMSANTEIM